MQVPMILLAEDDPIIALHMQLELEDMGYQVVTARDAREIIKLYVHHLPEIVVFNFWRCVERDGVSLARQLLAKTPAKVLFITGVRSQDLEETRDFLDGCKVLHKPFTRKQMIAFLLSLETRN